MKFSSAILITTTFVALLCGAACATETPTSARVENDFPSVEDGGDPSSSISVYKAWYFTTVFVDPIAPGASSAAQRTVAATDYAYAVLAVGWDPSSASPPAILIPVRSKTKLSIARGDALTIHVSDAVFDGHCTGGSTLSQDDADFITQRIFPGDFASVAYDAATCMATPLSNEDAGIPDSASDAGALDATGDADD